MQVEGLADNLAEGPLRQQVLVFESRHVKFEEADLGVDISGAVVDDLVDDIC